jgi:hypothetical protein
VTGIFNHIKHSDNKDPIRFFRGIVDSQNLKGAIDLFMPLKIEITPNSKQEFYETQGEYKNVDYINFCFERNEKDIDYKPERKGDPNELYHWIKFKFSDVLKVVLVSEISRSQSFIDAYLLTHSDSISTRIRYLATEVEKLKNILVEAGEDSISKQIAATLDELKNYINSKGPKEQDLPRITREVIAKIYDALIDNLELEVDKTDFVEWFFTFNSKRLPSKKIDIRIKNRKAIYYLLARIHALTPINYNKLSDLKFLMISGALFDASRMRDYPSGFPVSKRKLIDEFLQ